MVTLAFTIGQLVPLETLIGWVSNFAITIAVVIIGAIALPLVVEQINSQTAE